MVFVCLLACCLFNGGRAHFVAAAVRAAGCCSHPPLPTCLTFSRARAHTLPTPQTQSPHYLGPDFQTLESALQSAFYDFLASKGVDDAFCGSLLDFCASKEMVEYGNFLEEVAKFSKK
jgi:hypothetical protein